MTDIRPKIKSVHTFPSDVEDMIRTVATIRNAYLTNHPTRMAALRMTIRDSWQRCVPLMNPGISKAPIAVKTETELNNLMLVNEPFLKAASPVLDRLTTILSDSGYVIGLAETHGILLKVNGDQATLRQVATLGLVPGGDWSETAVGTNGIGTALAVRHAVRVIGPEHLADGWQDFSCITVPILDPWKGDVAGVLDVSGDYHLLRPFFAGILSAAALEIRSNLKHLYTPVPRTTGTSRIFIPVQPAESLQSPHQGTEPHGYKRIPADSKEVPTQRSTTAERLAIATGVVGINLDVDETLERVAKQFAYLFNLESSAVVLWEKQADKEIVRTWTKIPARTCKLEDSISHIIKQSDLLHVLKESTVPLVIDNLRVSHHSSLRSLEKRGILSLVLLPLIGSDGVRGMILLPRPVPHSWHPDELRLGLTFAFQCVTALENARLYQNILLHQQHLEALNSVNQLLNTIFDPIQQLEVITEQIVRILNLDAGLILLNQDRNAGLCLSSHYGLHSTTLPELTQLLGENCTVDEASSICWHTRQDHPAANCIHAAGLCDAVIVPLTAGVDRFGILLVGYYDHTAISSDDVTLISNIGHQIGLTIKNAQLLRTVAEAQVLREADNIKNKFLLMVSHDLRSPLTAIRTSVECLLDKSAKPSLTSQDEMLLIIASQAKRLGNLVDGLLDLTKIEANALKLDRDWTEPGALITDTIEKFKKLYFTRRVEWYSTRELPLLYVDPERIVQVLWNLLENAHKYSPTVTQITVEAFLNEDQVYLQVADRGPGIPLDEREKIFQYFYRLERENQEHTPGSGLGLAICQGIVEAHGGKIWAADRPGGGSLFTISLPPSLTNAVHAVMLGTHQTPASLPEEILNT